MMPDAEANRLRRIDAVLKQAEVKYALGRYAEHIQALDGIRRIVDETGDPPRSAAWHYWTGFLHSTSGGRPEVAIEHCREAAKIASAAGLDELNAFAESCLAQVYIVAGKLHDAVEAGERALSSFEAQGNLWWAARTLWHLSAAANCLGEWDAGLGYGAGSSTASPSMTSA
jgi:tetratricopeptide (TPR) repeat protein